jgi:DNA mismatch repair ATPase MutS
VKVLLMHRDRGLDLEGKLPANEYDLSRDLQLETLFKAMAGKDKFLLDLAKKVLLTSLLDVDSILFRQGVLKDCLKNPDVVAELFKLSADAIAKEKQDWAWNDAYKSADQTFQRSVRLLKMLFSKLKELRAIVDQHAGRFESDGFKGLFEMVQGEISDSYLASIEGHLKELELGEGTLISAELGEGNKGTGYALCRQPEDRKEGRRLFGRKTGQFTFTLNTNDQTGPEMMAELRDRGINGLANTLAQSSDHLLGFFVSLRNELAFYVACMNLRDQLAARGEPVCFPTPAERGRRSRAFKGLYDPCLALRRDERVVGNDLEAEGKDLVVVTGANRGGKSTFLRSVGISQLLMQAGAFAPGESLHADICTGVFTHFTREEDSSMKSGKLDEELGRMSKIVDSLSPDCMVLFNESFASTNEREGSEISRQIVAALLERRVEVFFVTHQYEFAHLLYEKGTPNAAFLRAQRLENGERTFRVLPGEPLPTSYGDDLYHRIFLAQGPGAKG